MVFWKEGGGLRHGSDDSVRIATGGMGTRGHFFWIPQLPLLLTALAPSVRGAVASSSNAKDVYWVWDSKRRHCIPSCPVSDCVITNLPTCQCIGHAFWPPHWESLCHLLSTNCPSDEAWSRLWIGVAFNFFLLILCLFLWRCLCRLSRFIFSRLPDSFWCESASLWEKTSMLWVGDLQTPSLVILWEKKLCQTMQIRVSCHMSCTFPPA